LENYLSAIEVIGPLRKMRVTLSAPVSYQLLLGEAVVPLNIYLGAHVRLKYIGAITCNHCGRKTKKSFSQGYCYPCFQTLAQCDSCIISPEKCHYFAGTCREPSWAENHCMQPHVVYLANSSGIKVGITRGDQVPTRWIDQGAVQALPILSVQTRQQSGFIEMLFKRHVADKTNWRAMLKGQTDVLDLATLRDELLAVCAEEIAELQQRFGLQAIQLLPAAEPVIIDYPVLEHPSKVTSLDFEKTPLIEGRLLGIKGQYLMLDSGVLNIRKFGAYHVSFSAG
jgi:hypothetical protein